MDKTKKDIISQRIIDAVNNNADFCKAFVAAEDAASVQKVLCENGFDVTLAEVNELFSEGVGEILKFKESGVDGELSEDQLAEVAGGGFFRGALRTVASAAAGFGFGCLCGVCPAAASATPYVVGGLTAWSTAGYMKRGW